jgi:uncharacterized protein (DUF1697 family)
VKSADLCACLTDAGFEEVAAFRTSGNVVFSASGSAEKVRSRIEVALRSKFRFDVPTFVRTEVQLREISGHEPFPRRAIDSSKGKLQVALLESKPDAKTKKQVLSLGSADDRLAFGTSELYWLPSGGTQKSGLDMKAIERAVGPNTMRTMGTIEQLTQKFFG